MHARKLIGLIIVALILPIGGHTAKAQERLSRAAINAGTVTILTDGLSTSTGRGARAMLSLAREVSRLGQLRVLPIAGEGGFQNLRDLLYLRGVDFAVLNSDVLTHQEIFGPFKNARGHTKLIAKLFDQRVLLLAKPSVTSVAGLSGRKLGVFHLDGAGKLTAETILRQLGIKADFVEIDTPNRPPAETLGGVDAVLGLEEEFVNSSIPRESWLTFSPLALELTPQLAKTYESATLERSFPIGKTQPADTPTIRAATVLAVFNWPASAARYEPVTKFIGEFFRSIVDLRLSPAGDLWNQVAPTEAVPGWQRYGPADPNRWLNARELARVARFRPTRLVEAPRPAVRPAPQPAPPAVSAARAAGGETIKVLVLERPPFSGKALPDGGIVTALLRNSLEAGAGGPAGNVEIEWISKGIDAALEKLAAGGYDVFLSSENAECEAPVHLTRAASFLCDEARASAPFMPVVIGLFVGAKSAITRLGGGTDKPMRICLAEGRYVGRLEEMKAPAVTLERRANLAECVSLVQNGEADAFVANELEGRFLIRKLGVDQAFRMLEDPLETRSMHASILKRRPGADGLIQRINDGIRTIKQSDVYGAVVRAHVMSLWRGEQTVRR